jgi:hypothetical protein
MSRYRTQDGRVFDVPDPYYLASCDSCGWVGSSRDCGSDSGLRDDSDVYCPVCHRAGADSGKVAEQAEEVVS